MHSLVYEIQIFFLHPLQITSFFVLSASVVLLNEILQIEHFKLLTVCNGKSDCLRERPDRSIDAKRKPSNSFKQASIEFE